MRKFLGTLKKFGKDEEGAALIEYTVLLGIMLVAVIATIGLVGTWISTQWTALNSALPAADEPLPGNRDRARIHRIGFAESIVKRQLRALHEADVIVRSGGRYFSVIGFFNQTPIAALINLADLDNAQKQFDYSNPRSDDGHRCRADGAQLDRAARRAPDRSRRSAPLWWPRRRCLSGPF